MQEAAARLLSFSKQLTKQYCLVHTWRRPILPLVLSLLALGAILYLLGWLPMLDAGKFAYWIRKNSGVLLAAAAVLILTRNPLLAVLAGVLGYSIRRKTGWFPGGLRQPGINGESRRTARRAMDPEEAYRVLELNPGANRADIQAAHRNLMKRFHPDQGGSTYLAAKVNEAKEVLLKNVKA